MIRIKPEILIPKLIAIGIVSVLIAWWMNGYGASQVAKLDSMTPAEYMAYKRHAYQFHPPYFAWIMVAFVLSSLYILVVEAITYVIRSFWPKKNPFVTNDKQAV